MQLMMRRLEISGICVSPPADKFDFAFAPCPASGLIVHGRDNTEFLLKIFNLL